MSQPIEQAGNPMPGRHRDVKPGAALMYPEGIVRLWPGEPDPPSPVAPPDTMSRRDHFAAAALGPILAMGVKRMHGVFGSPDVAEALENEDTKAEAMEVFGEIEKIVRETSARAAVAQADALIAALDADSES